MEKAKACKDLLANLFQPPFIHKSIKEKQKWKWRRYSSRTTSATFCAFSWRSKPLCWIWSVREGGAGPWRRNPCTACKSGCDENLINWEESERIFYLGIHRQCRLGIHRHTLAYIGSSESATFSFPSPVNSISLGTLYKVLRLWSWHQICDQNINYDTK